MDDFVRRGLTSTVFPGGPFPGMWALRDHFRRQVYAKRRARSICMRPARAAGCKADNKRGCCPRGLRGCNSSPAPATDGRRGGGYATAKPRASYKTRAAGRVTLGLNRAAVRHRRPPEPAVSDLLRRRSDRVPRLSNLCLSRLKEMSETAGLLMTHVGCDTVKIYSC